MFNIRYIAYLFVLMTYSLVQAETDGEAFLQAIVRDDKSMVMTYMVRGVDPNTRDGKGNTALQIAIKEQSWKAAETLLLYPALDVNARNQAGESALMLAALRGQLHWLKLLLGRGAAVNQTGWSALHYAASFSEDSACVEWLLKKGAEANARSPNGTTPLMMAARYGSEGAVDALLGAGADKSLANEQGLKALDFARAAGREHLFSRLQ